MKKLLRGKLAAVLYYIILSLYHANGGLLTRARLCFRIGLSYDVRRHGVEKRIKFKG